MKSHSRWYAETKDGGVRPIELSAYSEKSFIDTRRVSATDLPGGVRISTVFLGLDHGWGDGPPVLYETMIFGGPMDQEQDRYCTRAQAAIGHEEWVAKAKKYSLFQNLKANIPVKFREFKFRWWRFKMFKLKLHPMWKKDTSLTKLVSDLEETAEFKKSTDAKRGAMIWNLRKKLKRKGK